MTLDLLLEKKFRNLLISVAYPLSDFQIKQLIHYICLLHKWNKAYNLTAVRDPEEMLVKHILDSLAVGEFLQGDRFIDVGTGPGLPGIPLAIMFPQKQFVLLDSLGKRIQFLRTVLRELNLTNVSLVLDRVEDYQDSQGFDGVLSRAFASLQDMTQWCYHLPHSTGRFYALKGQNPCDEIALLSENLEIEAQIRLTIPQMIGERHLVIVKKN